VVVNLSENRITVVITSYNAGRYISRCINSALNQTFPDVEVIVVDDGSTDNTKEIVESYTEKVRYIRFESNKGPAAGRTKGLMEANTEFIAFLDSDDYWRPKFVETTVRFLRDNPEAIAVNTAYCKEDWDGRTYYRPILDEADREYYGGNGCICENFYEYWAKYRSILTGTVMMRTDIAQKTRGQQEDLRLTQDLEFWGYLATFGKWGYIPQHLFVTDERILTSKERWSKIKRRYAFFRELTIESWASRIILKLSDERSKKGFEGIVAHIATTIALANAYTFRFRKSRQLAIQWRDKLDRGLGSVLRLGLKGGPLLWPMVCLALRLREVTKTYTRPLKQRLFG